MVLLEAWLELCWLFLGHWELQGQQGQQGQQGRSQQRFRKELLVLQWAENSFW